jgi:VanZ family protein
MLAFFDRGKAMWRMLCALQFFVLLVIYSYLGLTSHPEGTLPVYNDLVMHFTGYAIAAFSISFAYPLWSLQRRASLLIVYSIAIEIGQHFNPPRTFSGMDILANIGGVILGLCVLLLLDKYWSWFHSLLYRQINTGNQGLQ